MKNNILNSILILSMIWFVSVTLLAQLPSGKEVLDRIDKNMNAKTREMTLKMEINTSRGIRTMQLKTWSEGETKAFTEYIYPAREKGTKMLKINNQLWIYSPSTDRIIQISGHMLRQSMMGSDMSYEDMMSDESLREKYSAEVNSEVSLNGVNCYVVTLNAKVPEVNYSTQKMWVDKTKFVPLRVDLYSKSQKLLKRIDFSNIQKVDGIWYPMEFMYKDMLKSGKGTRMIIENMKLNPSIPASVFNKSSLK